MNRRKAREVLDCASPLALFAGVQPFSKRQRAGAVQNAVAATPRPQNSQHSKLVVNILQASPGKETGAGGVFLADFIAGPFKDFFFNLAWHHNPPIEIGEDQIAHVDEHFAAVNRNVIRPDASTAPAVNGKNPGVRDRETQFDQI